MSAKQNVRNRFSSRAIQSAGFEVLEARCLLSAGDSPWDASALLDAPQAVYASTNSSPKESVSGKPTVTRDDYGNTFATAYPVLLSSAGSASLSGKLESTADTDMFSFVATVTGTLTVTMTSSGRKAPEPRLALYDGSQVKLAENARVTGSTKASLTIEVVQGQTYFAQAQTYTIAGGYTLQVATVKAPPSFDFLPGPSDFQPTGAVAGQSIATANGQVLVITGTDLTDKITLSQAGDVVTLAVTGAVSQSFTGPFAGVALYGFAGADVLQLNYTLSGSIVSVVYAGGDNDTIYEAGLDSASLYGQDGNDQIVAVGGGADFLYGGAGFDTFWFDSNDTLSDADAAETAFKTIHKITAFTAPVAGQTVSMEIAGQNLTDPTSGYTYTSNFVNRPLFADGPQYNDIRQGALGDCYFLAGLSALSQTDPGYILQSITSLGDGTYAVRFFSAGIEKYYRIDGQLPTNGSAPAYANLTRNGGETWVALLEKAFAQFRRGQNSYASIEGGYMDEAYTAITGGGYWWYYTSSSTADALAQRLSNELTAGNAVTAASAGNIAPIVGGHAYEVHAVDYDVATGTWYVTVYNPWGVDGGTWDSVNDGLLRLTAAEFQTRFSYIETCGV